MTTVYVVLAGEYSDYSIVAVFLDRAKAEAIAPDSDEYGARQVEEFELDPPVAQVLLIEDLIVRAADGTIRSIQDGDTSHAQWYVRKVVDGGTERFDLAADFKDSKSTVNASLGDGPGSYPIDLDQIQIRVEGTDFARVHKVFTELRAHAIAGFDLMIAAEAERLKQREVEYQAYLAKRAT